MKAMMLLNPKRRRRRSRRRGAKRRMRANPVSHKRRRRSRRRSRRNPIANLNPHRRRRRSGRRYRRNPFGGGKVTSTIKGIFGKDNLVIAGGAVLGTVATRFIIGKWGAKLPGIATPMGAVGYSVAIPAVLAAVAASASPKLRGVAQGMGIIAAVNLVSTAVAYAQGAVTGTSAYLDSNGVRALPNRPPGYDGVNAFGQSIYGNESAFRSNTWALAE